ncbi:hypothetical protein FHG87_006672 [Trinorchestia longiramus]|nr:hypothetical protein FHG87_006672 [Trinorchestia longiramus]
MWNTRVVVVMLMLVMDVELNSAAPVAGSYLADAPPHVPRIGRRSELPQEGRLPLTHAQTVYYLLPRHYPRVGRSDPSLSWYPGKTTQYPGRTTQYQDEDLLSLLQLEDTAYGTAPLHQRTSNTAQLHHAPAENVDQTEAGESKLDDLYDDPLLDDDAVKRYGQSSTLFDDALLQDDNDGDTSPSPLAAGGSRDLEEPLLTCGGAECALPRGLLKALVRSLVQRATDNARSSQMLPGGSRLRERQLRRICVQGHNAHWQFIRSLWYLRSVHYHRVVLKDNSPLLVKIVASCYKMSASVCVCVTLILVNVVAEPNFFSDSGKDLPSIGRRSSIPAALGVRPEDGRSREYAPSLPASFGDRASTEQNKDQLAALQRSLSDIYDKLDTATRRVSQEGTCLSKREAAEVLKLLQAATRNKIFCGILNERMKHVVEEQGVMGEEQNGFRRDGYVAVCGKWNN